MTDGQNIALVWLGEDDWPLWRSIRLRALGTDPAAFSSTHAASSAMPDAAWRALLADPAGRFLLATAAGHPVGMVRGGVGDDGDARVAGLFGMWVEPGWRGRGIGRMLVAAMIGRLARESGITVVRLSVRESQHPARALYASLGFGVVGREVDGPPEVVMELPLG